MTLLVWLLAGCAGGPAAPAAPPSWGSAAPVAVGVDLVAYVPRARIVPAAEGARLEVDLALENVDRGVPDGTHGRRGGVVIERSRVVLRVDGQAVQPDDAAQGFGWLGPVLEVSPEGASQVRGLLSYAVPTERPTSLVLEIDSPRGALLAPITGRLEGGGRPLVLLGADERVVLGPPRGGADRPDPAPADRAGWVTVDGAALPAPGAPSAPWILPAGARRVEVAAPGYDPLAVDVPDGDGAVFLRLAPDASLDPWARAVDLSPDPSRDRWDLEAVSRSLRDADAVITFVRDAIGVLPTAGLQRSPAATLRERAGGPLDRAELARALLRRLGQRAEIACGDLPRGQLELLGSGRAAVDLDIGAIRDAVTARMPAERPATRLERASVVPEWCDVALDGEPVPRDLRPTDRMRAWGPITPIEYWTSRASISESLWRVDLTFRAVVREGPEAWRTVDLMTYETDAPTLSERGFLFDVYREVTDRGLVLQPMLSVVSDGEVAGQLGASLPAIGVERVLLDVAWRDPLRVSSVTRSIPVWERGAGDLDALRAMVTGDAGRVPDGRVQERLRAAFGGRWPGAAAHAMLAWHDALAGGVADAGVEAPPVPVVRVTVLQDLADGRRLRRVEQAPAAASSWERRADAGAALVAAMAREDARLGRAVSPVQPLTWARTVDELLRLGFADTAVQTRARRDVEGGAWVGVDVGGQVWRYEVDSGGALPYGVGVAMPRYAGEGEVAPGPAGAHARWAVPVLCASLPAEGAPAACAVRP